MLSERELKRLIGLATKFDFPMVEQALLRELLAAYCQQNNLPQPEYPEKPTLAFPTQTERRDP